jgi:hypothetical protein
MSELVLLGLKLGFLAALWLLILFTGNVIRTDLFGRKLSPSELAAAGALAAGDPVPKLSKRAERKLPRTLKVTHGPQSGVTLPLGQPILIGRAADCQLLLDDDYVSTRHARITLGPVGYQLEDLGSTNGSFVNNQRISTPTAIGPADTVRIGRTLMVLEK